LSSSKPSAFNRRFGADTVYAFNGAALEIFKAAKRLGLRTILDQTAAPWRWNSALLQAERDRWPGWEDQPAEMDHSGLLTLREEEEWERADRIICGSDFSREALLETAGKSYPCSVVPYPCLARQAPALRDATSTAYPDELRILFVGTLQLRKGLPYLLAALRLLNDPRLRVRLVGPSLLSAAAMEQLAACCELVGPVPRSDVYKHYEWADVFVLPTLSEGSANVVYEALMAGLPVITTREAGSIIQHGVDGLLIPAGSAAQLAEVLDLLLHSTEMRETLVSNAMQSLAHHDKQTYQRRLIRCVS
jgi:glycosyltransferase involved in cell wall biosynthesis